LTQGQYRGGGEGRRVARAARRFSGDPRRLAFTGYSFTSGLLCTNLGLTRGWLIRAQKPRWLTRGGGGCAGGGVPLGAVAALSWCGKVALGGKHVVNPIPLVPG